MLGWRITCAPELENDWDAISGVAAWVGVLISAVGVVSSFVAIWYAIQVPKKIADRQDKIALFEKRYECFQLFELCFVLYKRLTDKTVASKVIEQCCFMLGVEKLECLSEQYFENKISQFEYVLHQMGFLFPGIAESDVAELYNSLSSYLRALANQQETEESKQRYINVMTGFGKYINEIWDAITISNIN